MNEKNASGQLYVYTNKKSMSNPDKELSAFLHLDLEHLGGTDVSIKMFIGRLQLISIWIVMSHMHW